MTALPIKSSASSYKKALIRFMKGASLEELSTALDLPMPLLIAWRDSQNWEEARIQYGLGEVQSAGQLVETGAAQLNLRYERIGGSIEYLLERGLKERLEAEGNVSVGQLATITKTYRMLQDGRRLSQGLAIPGTLGAQPPVKPPEVQLAEYNEQVHQQAVQGLTDMESQDTEHEHDPG